MRRYVVLIMLTVIISGCEKASRVNVGCEAEVCTEEFVSIPISFSSYSYSMFTVKNVTAVNLRTGFRLDIKPVDQVPNVPMNTYIVANDNIKSRFSEEGDDVLVTGTHSATNQTKTAVVKISGGCNCHVSKKSGPATIMFD